MSVSLNDDVCELFLILDENVGPRENVRRVVPGNLKSSLQNAVALNIDNNNDNDDDDFRVTSSAIVLGVEDVPIDRNELDHLTVPRSSVDRSLMQQYPFSDEVTTL